MLLSILSIFIVFYSFMVGCIFRISLDKGHSLPIAIIVGVLWPPLLISSYMNAFFRKTTN